MLHLVVALVFALSAAPASACFIGPAVGYWDCLLEEPTFFNGEGDDLLMFPPQELDDSFDMRFFMSILPFKGGIGTVYVDGSLTIEGIQFDGLEFVFLTVTTTEGFAGVFGKITGGGTVRLEVTEIPASDLAPDLVVVELYIDAVLVDSDLALGQVVAGGRAYIGATSEGLQPFLGFIGPFAIARDPVP